MLLACHGIPERCLRVRGRPMRICARCTGIYLGYLALLGFAWQFWQEGTLPRPWPMLLLHLPLLADGLTQAAGWRQSTNALRLLTGVLAGVGQVGLLAWCALGSGRWFAGAVLG